MERLAGKRIVVTGAASGLGYAAAERFLQEGARVVIIDLDQDGLDNAVGRLGTGATAIRCDVASEDDTHRVIQAAASELGGIDVYYNNAGVAHPVTPLSEITKATWDKMIAVNLTAIFIAAKELAPLMGLQDSGGTLLITSSISGRRPRPGLTAYAASKGGAIAITAALAVELAPKIRVNGIAPLAVPTPMLSQFSFAQEGETEAETNERLASVVPLKRLTEPADVAAAAVYLASDEASGVTGVTLNVDSGRHL